MKNIKVFCSIVLFLSVAFSSPAQIRNGIWQGHINYRGTSMLTQYAMNLTGATISKSYMKKHAPAEEITIFGSAESYADNMLIYSTYARWINPHTGYYFHIPNWSMQYGNQEEILQGPQWWKCLLFGDFKHDYNYSLGYFLTYRSYILPFGFSIGANYEWRGLCVKSGTLAGLHRVSGITAEVRLRAHLLGLDFERDNGWNIIPEVSTSYTKNITYNDPLGYGNKIVGNGWRSSIAMSLRYFRAEWGIRYEWDLYDFFNISECDTRLQNLSLSVSVYL